MSFECSNIRFPFGIHQGHCLGEIPSSYLRFIIESNDGRLPDLVEDCRDELQRRERNRNQSSVAEIRPIQQAAQYEWELGLWGRLTVRRTAGLQAGLRLRVENDTGPGKPPGTHWRGRQGAYS